MRRATGKSVLHRKEETEWRDRSVRSVPLVGDPLRGHRTTRKVAHSRCERSGSSELPTIQTLSNDTHRLTGRRQSYPLNAVEIRNPLGAIFSEDEERIERHVASSKSLDQICPSVSSRLCTLLAESRSANVPLHRKHDAVS